MTDFINNAFKDISSILNNGDSERIKLTEINKIVQQIQEGKEPSLDDMRESILKALNNNPEKLRDDEIISQIKYVINYKLQSADARRLSENVREHIKAIQDKSLIGFTHVTRMYRVTFWAGVVMLFFGVFLTGFFAINNTPYDEVAPYLAIVFSGGGVSSMFVSLRQTARKLQQSRANASQLAMALNEWQFLSLWSGKTYQHLLEKFNKNPSSDTSVIKTFEHFLQWKETLTQDMIKHVEKYVANGTDHISSDSEDSFAALSKSFNELPTHEIDNQKKGALPKGY